MSQSVLDRPVRLAEIFEPELFAELCRAYADLYRVGIKVFDAQQEKLVDVGGNNALIQYLFQFTEAQRRLTAFVSELKHLRPEPEEWLVRDDHLSGLRYLVVALAYEGDVLGKLVVGPYVAESQPLGALPVGDWFLEADAEKFIRLRSEHPRFKESALRKVLDAMLKAINVVCHSGYKSILTSNMHLESITSAYDEVQQKNQQLEERNRQLQETNERLRELDKLKSNFLATVSHELRTPLTSVIGYSEMLLEGLAGELQAEQKEYVSTIMEKGESLLHLISGILDISKIEKGAQEIVRQTVKPEALVESAVSTIHPQAQKKELSLLVEYVGQLPEIRVDTYKIRQILINLLGNATKFTSPGGRITVIVDEVGPEAMPALALRTPRNKRPERYVRFRVADTGIGIPADKLDRIFDVFFQVDNSSTREYGGTGLGLSIVKNFVESHDGDVSVESELGRGSTFTFVVPLPNGPLPAGKAAGGA